MSVISIENLHVHFRGTRVLDGVNLRIEPASVFALLGENGVGKTTLIRCLTGFQKPARGRIDVLGMDPTKDRLKIRRRVGYVSDAPALYDWMRIDEIGAFTAAFFGQSYYPNYQRLITAYQLPPDQKIKQLSKGQRAKVALSLAVSHDPELLIMDEPTSGLDPMVRRDFLESMIDRAITGRTVFLSSHQISEVERVADTVAILHRGKIRLQGPLEEIKSSIRQWTIDVDDPLVTLPALDSAVELLAEQTSGRQRRLVVRGATPDMLAAFRQVPGVVEIREQALSLEDIFITLTRGLPEPGGPPSTRSVDQTDSAQSTLKINRDQSNGVTA